MIYLNNCLTSKPAPEAVEAMLPFLQEQFFYPGNFIESGTRAGRYLQDFKKILAKSINAQPEEIHLTSGGTSANNLGIKGFLTANAEVGTHIICSVGDYPDLLSNAAFFEQAGYEVSYLPINEEGFLDTRELRKAIRPDTVLFMTTLANHTVGAIQPMEEINEILGQCGRKIAVFADACEAYGRMEIDVEKLGIDLMSVSSHKIHGPQGAGFLYVKNGTPVNTTKQGIVRVDDLETGGVGLANLAGFTKAVELAFADLQGNISYMKMLSDYLLKRLREEIPYTLVNGPVGDSRISHNINISFDFIEGEAILMMLDLMGILVATGSACASEGLRPNYVLMAMGRSHVQSHGSIKFTVSRYNTKEEIDEVVAKLKEIVANLRARSPLYADFLKNKGEHK